MEEILNQIMDSETSESKLEQSGNNKLPVIYVQNSETDTFRGAGPCAYDHEAIVPNIETNKRWCIGRVPPHVREDDEKAYNPKILSIGPFHHKKEGLEAMEVLKSRFLKRLEDQIILESQGTSSLNLEGVMKDMEKSTRECYSEEFDDISSKDFVQMLVLDACFIVELLRLHENGSQEKIKDVQEPIFGTRWMLPIIGRDLLLMENQLPMFILQKVFALTTFSDNPTPLDKLALNFFKSYLRPLPPSELSSSQLGTKNTAQENNHIDHLLALFQASFAPTDLMGIESSPHNIIIINAGSCLPCYRAGNDNSLLHKNVGNGNNSSSSGSSSHKNVGNRLRLPKKGWVPNAKMLSWAGIRFSVQDSDPGFLVEFKGDKLKIPALLLGDDTYVHLLRNMLAYEQSSTRVLPYITCFAIFLGSLIDTPEDIKILLDKGIIKHAKGSNAKIVNLVKSLSWDVHRFDIKYCYMAKQIKCINKFSQSKRGKIRRGTIAALKKFAQFFKWLLVSLFFIVLPVLLYNFLN